MAAPNLFNSTTANGKTATVDLSTTSATSVLSNASGSGKCLKVNTILVANDDGTNSSTITLSYYSAAALGGTPVEFAKTVPVAAGTVVSVIDTPIYVEEDKSIGATAANANRLNVLCSYEDIG